MRIPVAGPFLGSAEAWTWKILSVSLLLVACAGDSEDIDAPPFSEIRDDILMPSCGLSNCHGGAEPFVLSEDTTAADLVNVPSIDAPGEILVVAGDPDASYLVHKIEGRTSIVGEPMPPPFGGLQPDQIQTIRDWIAAGAED